MSDHRVLVVEDDESIAELYRTFLEAEYPVESAHTVEEAIELVESSGESYDVVLLDRRLPDGPGRTVLEAIRDRNLDCRVAMVTGVEPDFDILDMGFDLYLIKPIGGAELENAVKTLVNRLEYDDLLQRAAALASKRAVLESQKSRTELEESKEYERLLEEIDELDEDLMEMAKGLSTEDYRAVFRDLGQA